MLTLVFVCLSFSLTGLHASFSVAVNGPIVKVKENEGVDLQCSYTADFGATPRVEWKFRNLKGFQYFIYFNNKPTVEYEQRITVYAGGLRFQKVTRADAGDYNCEVSGNGGYGENTIKLVVSVPPSKPVSSIPSSVTTGSNVRLTCFDPVGSPPSTYEWYKDNNLLPEDPTKFPIFKNLTYKMNAFNGNLEFLSVSKWDAGSYFCVASNENGVSQHGDAVKMEVYDVDSSQVLDVKSNLSMETHNIPGKITNSHIMEKQYGVFMLQEVKLKLEIQKLELEVTKLKLELQKLGHEV
ncbi:F11 receptor, tandem duplicate 2 precursor [Danio rerio]|uniref:Junctional adhesion molecule A n=1 Tax=Danio rerio TaxID=7955 RepID=A3KNL2_DANRE|nr:F11 receptor, tandem duplicate 2 precursor [Danio rerio]AAI33902.1 Si:ch211-89p1.1 protein [Danio rerio]|eukprot:NP_001076451.1 F11 receptor precursor [Danio rerio]